MSESNKRQCTFDSELIIIKLRSTLGELLARYPQINWKGVMGVRDRIAHSYSDIDTEQLFDICENKVPELIDVPRVMIRNLEMRN